MPTRTQNKTSQELETDVSQEAVKERSYLWMMRVFAIVSLIAVVVNLFVFGALISLTPIVRVQPFYLFALNKNQQTIFLARPSPEVLQSKDLQEAFVRQYLLSYFTIGANVAEQERRWGPEGMVDWMSTPAVFGEFTKSADYLINLARTEGLVRSARILVANEYKTTARGVIWTAEVETKDMKRDSSTPDLTVWTVQTEISFQPRQRGLTWAQRLKNPLGFTVSGFGAQRKT